MKKEDCRGCYNDDYNHGLGGATECWSFDRGKKLERKFAIHVDRRPPYGKHLIRKVPPCYTQSRMVFVKLEALTADGFWK